MFWGSFAASDTGYLETVHGNIKLGDYRCLLEQIVALSARNLRLCHGP